MNTVAFPERLHHPKEDEYLFRAIRDQSPEALPLLDQLDADHAYGQALTQQLQDRLLAYEHDMGQGTAFCEAVEQYAEFHWAHMRREETELLPLAERALSIADWRTIERAFKAHDDPLFGLKPQEEMDELFRRIVTIAPAPIGVGSPEAGA